MKPDGKLALLDFGVVGRLREETMDAIAGLFLAVLERDEDQVVASLERLGVVGEGHIPVSGRKSANLSIAIMARAWRKSGWPRSSKTY